MKKILVMQSRRMPEMIVSEQEKYRRVVGENNRVDFISSLDESLSWNSPEDLLASYDAIILSGSGDFDFDGGRDHDDDSRYASREIVNRVQNLIRYILRNNFPLLGICFGHQIVSEVLGVRVIHDHSQKKVGSHEVSLTDAGKNDILFSEFPETFFVQYMHKDSLSDYPEGAILLARSHCCRASALRFGTKVYTMQFHPELTAEDLSKKLMQVPGYLSEGIDPKSVVFPSPHASTIIPRFLENVVE